jgi:hypothetical protein
MNVFRLDMIIGDVCLKRHGRREASCFVSPGHHAQHIVTNLAIRDKIMTFLRRKLFKALPCEAAGAHLF